MLTHPRFAERSNACAVPATINCVCVDAWDNTRLGQAFPPGLGETTQNASVYHVYDVSIPIPSSQFHPLSVVMA